MLNATDKRSAYRAEVPSAGWHSSTVYAISCTGSTRKGNLVFYSADEAVYFDGGGEPDRGRIPWICA